jgi:hypothetical protein
MINHLPVTTTFRRRQQLLWLSPYSLALVGGSAENFAYYVVKAVPSHPQGFELMIVIV